MLRRCCSPSVSNATALPSPLIAGLDRVRRTRPRRCAGGATDQRQCAAGDVRRVDVVVGFGVGARERVRDRRGEGDGRAVAAEIGFVVGAAALRAVRADADQLRRAGFEVAQVHVTVLRRCPAARARGRGERHLAPVAADDRFGRVAFAGAARRGHADERHRAGETVLDEDVDEAVDRRPPRGRRPSRRTRRSVRRLRPCGCCPTRRRTCSFRRSSSEESFASPGRNALAPGTPLTANSSPGESAEADGASVAASASVAESASAAVAPTARRHATVAMVVEVAPRSPRRVRPSRCPFWSPTGSSRVAIGLSKLTRAEILPAQPKSAARPYDPRVPSSTRRGVCRPKQWGVRTLVCAAAAAALLAAPASAGATLLLSVSPPVPTPGGPVSITATGTAEETGTVAFFQPPVNECMREAPVAAGQRDTRTAGGRQAVVLCCGDGRPAFRRDGGRGPGQPPAHLARASTSSARTSKRKGGGPTPPRRSNTGSVPRRYRRSLPPSRRHRIALRAAGASA